MAGHDLISPGLPVADRLENGAGIVMVHTFRKWRCRASRQKTDTYSRSSRQKTDTYSRGSREKTDIYSRGSRQKTDIQSSLSFSHYEGLVYAWRETSIPMKTSGIKARSIACK